MSSNLGVIIQSIITSSTETPQILLKSWLDQLYTKSSKFGLSSSQLIKLIGFICESPTLSFATKNYIIDNCFLPNEYISREVIKEIISHLGTATAVSEFKLQTPLWIQAALCKWLVQVYFLIIPQCDDYNYNIDSSIWIHLWQFDYLQHWVTYILVWSTTTVKDIKRWRVVLLENVGSKTGYNDAQACATLILKRYEAILGKSDLISDAITRLNCNARRLQTLQNLEIDKVFSNKLRNILINESPVKFTGEMVDELLSSNLKTLQFSRDGATKLRYHPEVPIGKISLLDIHSLDQLAWHWGKIKAPKNVETCFSDHKAFPLLFFMLPLSKSDAFCIGTYEWISVNLKRFFSNMDISSEREAGVDSILLGIVRVCQLHNTLAAQVIKDFLTLDNLNANTGVFMYLSTSLLTLASARTKEVDTIEYRRNVMQILAFCHLDKKKRPVVFPRICKAVILMVNSWLEDDIADLIIPGLEILHGIQKLLISDFVNPIENRHITIAIISLLKTLPNTQARYHDDAHLSLLILTPSMMYKLLIGDDPLLLDACCNYLINTKKFFLDMQPANQYVQYQNQYIMDLTNYLWRNKILTSSRFFGIPTDFLQSLIHNLYFPNPEYRTKALFSITGIPALSYGCTVKLRDLESIRQVRKHYSELINEEGFKKFSKNLPHKEYWLDEMNNMTELKVEILKTFSNLGPYRHIALFLFTYLKSLSHYNTANR